MSDDMPYGLCDVASLDILHTSVVNTYYYVMYSVVFMVPHFICAVCVRKWSRKELLVDCSTVVFQSADAAW
jgi:hypothetical protein